MKVPSNVEETVNTVLKYFAHKKLPIENSEESRKFFDNFSVMLAAKLKDKKNDDELLGSFLFSIKLLVLYPSNIINNGDFQRSKYEYDHVNDLYDRAKCLNGINAKIIDNEDNQMLDAVSIIDRLNGANGEACSRNFYLSYPMLKFLCISDKFTNTFASVNLVRKVIPMLRNNSSMLGIAADAVSVGLQWLPKQQFLQLQKVISVKRNEIDAMKEETEERFSKQYRNELKNLPSFPYVIESFIERMVEICYSKQVVENTFKCQQGINDPIIPFEGINWDDFPEKKELSKFSKDLFTRIMYKNVPELMNELKNNLKS